MKNNIKLGKTNLCIIVFVLIFLFIILHKKIKENFDAQTGSIETVPIVEMTTPENGAFGELGTNGTTTGTETSFTTPGESLLNKDATNNGIVEGTAVVGPFRTIDKIGCEENRLVDLELNCETQGCMSGNDSLKFGYPYFHSRKRDAIDCATERDKDWIDNCSQFANLEQGYPDFGPQKRLDENCHLTMTKYEEDKKYLDNCKKLADLSLESPDFGGKRRAEENCHITQEQYDADKKYFKYCDSEYAEYTQPTEEKRNTEARIRNNLGCASDEDKNYLKYCDSEYANYNGPDDENRNTEASIRNNLGCATDEDKNYFIKCATDRPDTAAYNREEATFANYESYYSDATDREKYGCPYDTDENYLIKCASDFKLDITNTENALEIAQERIDLKCDNRNDGNFINDEDFIKYCTKNQISSEQEISDQEISNDMIKIKPFDKVRDGVASSFLEIDVNDKSRYQDNVRYILDLAEKRKEFNCDDGWEEKYIDTCGPPQIDSQSSRFDYLKDRINYKCATQCEKAEHQWLDEKTNEFNLLKVLLQELKELIDLKDSFSLIDSNELSKDNIFMWRESLREAIVRVREEYKYLYDIVFELKECGYFDNMPDYNRLQAGQILTSILEQKLSSEELKILNPDGKPSHFYNSEGIPICYSDEASQAKVSCLAPSLE